MALGTSDLALDDFYIEFTGNYPTGGSIALNDFYHPNGDPYLPTPFPYISTHNTEPEISFNDFFGADGKTAELTCAHSWDQEDTGKARFGWQTYKGGIFQYSTGETGASFNAFGHISRNLTFSTSQKLIGIYGQRDGTNNGQIFIVKRGSGNNGWSSMKFRYNNIKASYGEPTNVNFTNYTTTLNRSNADDFTYISNSYYDGAAAYYWRFECTTSTEIALYRALRGAAIGRPVSMQDSGHIAIKIIT